MKNTAIFLTLLGTAIASPVSKKLNTTTAATQSSPSILNTADFDLPTIAVHSPMIPTDLIPPATKDVKYLLHTMMPPTELVPSATYNINHLLHTMMPPVELVPTITPLVPDIHLPTTLMTLTLPHTTVTVELKTATPTTTSAPAPDGKHSEEQQKSNRVNMKGYGGCEAWDKEILSPVPDSYMCA